MDHGSSNLPLVPTAKAAWRPFPSYAIPKDFKYYNILEYYEEIPQVTYSYKEGIQKISQPIPVLHENSDSEEDEDDENGEGLLTNDITNLCRRAIMKCIDKGECFLKSGRVLSVLDAQRDNHYFIKGQVQASMEAHIYPVVIIMECGTGKICDASCLCKTQALKRCGHIAAVLLMMWRHVCKDGFEGKTIEM